MASSGRSNPANSAPYSSAPSASATATPATAHRGGAEHSQAAGATQGWGSHPGVGGGAGHYQHHHYSGVSLPPSAGREGPTTAGNAGGAAGGGGFFAGLVGGMGGRRSPLAPPSHHASTVPSSSLRGGSTSAAGAAAAISNAAAAVDHELNNHPGSQTYSNNNTSSTSHSPLFSSFYRFSAAAATPTASSSTFFPFSPRGGLTLPAGVTAAVATTGITGGGQPPPPPLQYHQQQRRRPSEGNHAEHQDQEASSHLASNPPAVARPQIVDGIPLDEIRALACDPNHLSNLFYAQLLHSKTQLASDALLLARAYLQHGQSGACWRVLDESRLLVPQQQQHPHQAQWNDGGSGAVISWPAVDVAVSALASTEEWAVLQQFVQDLLADWFPDTGPEHDGGASDLERRLIESLAVTPTTSSIDDDLSRRDEDRRLASRVWYWRGRAHWELGDPVLATQHWSAALELDARNQAAWNALLSLQLLTPQQACELLTTRVRFARNDGWLRALYLAQIAVTQKSPEKDSSSVRPRSTSLLSLPPPLQETSPGRGALNFGDASSIQLSSPMMSPPFHLNDENNAAASSKRISAGGQLPPRGTSANADAHAQPSEPCHAKVHEAFAELTNTYRLGQSPHVMALAARRAYNCYDWKTCLSVCEQLVAQGSIVPSSAPSISSLPSVSSLSSFSDAAYCYVAVLVLLGRHRSLFSLAHEWVSAAPKSPLSWFAVGAYYYATGRYHVAQRHFCRATRLDPHCSPAWMAFGCSFAVVDESDQALASFRAAQRLAPGDALPLLYMGVEYVRTNHLPLAQHFLRCARVQSQDDPLCLHESGVLEFQRGNLESAIQWFSGALRTLSRCSALDGGASCVSVKAAVLECSDPYWEPTIFNLGHAFRKTRQFDLAKTCFERCIALTQSASAYSALAFTNHLSGEVDAAISLYHQALAVKPDDPFSSEMLGRALRESMQQGIDELLSIPATRPPASSKRLLRGHDTSSSLAVGSINKLGDESILSEGGTMDQSEDMDSDVDMNG